VLGLPLPVSRFAALLASGPGLPSGRSIQIRKHTIFFLFWDFERAKRAENKKEDDGPGLENGNETGDSYE
jgi:hypothetical protein